MARAIYLATPMPSNYKYGAMKKTLFVIFGVVFLGIATFLVFAYYSYIFSKNVEGQISKVERVTNPTAVIGSDMSATQLFSFAVAIREKSGEIVTASSEDRQWAVAQEGHCVVAKLFPYPPWNLDKSGTYFGARLLRLYECDKAPGN